MAQPRAAHLEGFRMAALEKRAPCVAGGAVVILIIAILATYIFGKVFEIFDGVEYYY